MDIYGKVLIAQCRHKNIDIEVCGSSMYPEIKGNDIITIKQQDEYNIGDVIVFMFEKRIVVHRILNIVASEYWCKGDNSFRLEKVSLNKVVGIVTHVNQKRIEHCLEEKVIESFGIYLEFRKSGFDIDKVMASDVYKKYAEKYIYV